MFHGRLEELDLHAVPERYRQEAATRALIKQSRESSPTLRSRLADTLRRIADAIEPASHRSPVNV